MQRSRPALEFFLKEKKTTIGEKVKLVDEKIEDYCRAHTTPLPEIFSRLRETTYAEARSPQMQVGLLEGQFLRFLVRLIQAERILEFGTFKIGRAHV